MMDGSWIMDGWRELRNWEAESDVRRNTNHTPAAAAAAAAAISFFAAAGEDQRE